MFLKIIYKYFKIYFCTYYPKMGKIFNIRFFLIRDAVLTC